MWQVSGGHGYRPEVNSAIASMREYADDGKLTHQG